MFIIFFPEIFILLPHPQRGSTVNILAMLFDFCGKYEYKIRNGWVVYPLSILSFLFMQHTGQTIGSGGSNHRDAGKMVNRYLDYSLFVRKKYKKKFLFKDFLGLPTPS